MVFMEGSSSPFQMNVIIRIVFNRLVVFARGKGLNENVTAVLNRESDVIRRPASFPFPISCTDKHILLQLLTAKSANGASGPNVTWRAEREPPLEPARS